MPSRRKLLILAAAIGIFFLLVIAAGVAVFFSPLLTRYVEGDAFRVAMEEETAKGLHFPQASYAPIRRTGALTAQSDSFKADNGQKAMKSLDAHGITAKFDPWGVFLRQWRFTDVRVQSGDVEIQIYEANPEAVPGKPWFAIFLPNRVYLEKIRIGTGQHHLAFSRRARGLFRNRTAHHTERPRFRVRRDRRSTENGDDSRSRSSPHTHPDHENAFDSL